MLDLAIVGEGRTIGEALAATVTMARAAERHGYRRVWYAEHHNMESIASSATSVLIAHVAAHTERIRLGAGGVMLPNHSPLVIAEQFGTLAELHPGRIDLGLGRAPGTDQLTFRALRRDLRASDRFPEDVLELQHLLGERREPGAVQAIPGRGTHVPLYVLGSSLFGAGLAAHLGLPYAFASHFAPELLIPAVEHYRSAFQPSAQLDAPYVIAGVNVVAADDAGEAARLHAVAQRQRVARFLRRARPLSDEEVEAALPTPAGQQILAMMRYCAVGDARGVGRSLNEFAAACAADEVMVVHAAPTLEHRLRSVELTAAALGLTGDG